MSQGLRMVHLRTVPDSWHAKVLAARLGSEGIVTQFQGSVSGPYPFGAVSVFVESDQAELAAALLLADEVEAAFTDRQVINLDTGVCTYVDGPGFDDIALGGPGRHDMGLRSGNSLAEGAAHSGHHRRWVSRKRRAAAAVAAVMVAGAPVLAHFMGQ